MGRSEADSTRKTNTRHAVTADVGMPAFIAPVQVNLDADPYGQQFW